MNKTRLSNADRRPRPERLVGGEDAGPAGKEPARQGGERRPSGAASRHRPNQTSSLRLKDKAHVYDSRRGKYLGLTDSIPVKFNPDWVADFFAALPYQVKAVEVKAARGDESGSPVIDFDLSVKSEGGKLGTHILSVSVLNPRGELLPSYSQRITAQNGTGKGRLWLAENDPKGPWTIRVRDAASGVKGEATIK